jgi:hypothetical protein
MGYLVHQLLIHNDVLFLTNFSLSVGLDPIRHFYLEMPLSIYYYYYQVIASLLNFYLSIIHFFS